MTSLRLIEIMPDIADKLEHEASFTESLHPGDSEIAVMRSAATLIRDLDRAISHMVAVKGSQGLSACAVSILHDAITRQQRRGESSS